MEAKKVAKILAKYKNENLGYGYITHLDPKTQQSVRVLQIRVGPLPISSPGHFEHALASRIAKKHGITFKDYNSNVGTDDPPLYRSIFSTICYGEDEIRTKMKLIMQAEDELKSSLESLAESLVQK
jgi:hypothetical protein